MKKRIRFKTARFQGGMGRQKSRVVPSYFNVCTFPARLAAFPLRRPRPGFPAVFPGRLPAAVPGGGRGGVARRGAAGGRHPRGGRRKGKGGEVSLKDMWDVFVKQKFTYA